MFLGTQPTQTRGDDDCPEASSSSKMCFNLQAAEDEEDKKKFIDRVDRAAATD